jgi:phage shock protein B
MEAVAIIFMVCVAPLAIVLHYVTKWKAARGLSEEEERTMEELWRASQALENRLQALETILDDDLPGWRNRG